MRHRRLAVVLALIFACSRAAFGGDPPKKVEVKLVILTDMNLVPLTVDQDPFVAWLKPVIAAVEAKFLGETKPRTVVVQVTLHAKKKADVEVVGRPALSDDEAEALLTLADAEKAPHAKVAECSFQIVAEINGGGGDKGKKPGPNRLLKTPDEKKMAEFEAASTADRLKIMKAWARTQAIPILSAMAAGADPKFVGVCNLGKSIANLDPEKRIDVAALTDHNPDYWRATLEMSPGNPLTAAIRVALLAANGEIDYASRVAQISRRVDGGQAGASHILGEFRGMQEIFIKGVEAKIQEGIALHDKGEFDRAAKVYDALLKVYPNSAWANYERFQTKMAEARDQNEAMEKVVAQWPKVKGAILSSDPLYPHMAMASGPVEIFRLRRRIEGGTLFKKQAEVKHDALEYAEIALDLDFPGLAAMLYWDAVLVIRPNEKQVNDLIEHFLYCLEELKVTGIKDNFNGDHAAEFARIKADQARRMEEEPAGKK